MAQLGEARLSAVAADNSDNRRKRRRELQPEGFLLTPTGHSHSQCCLCSSTGKLLTIGYDNAARFSADAGILLTPGQRVCLQCQSHWTEAINTAQRWGNLMPVTDMTGLRAALADAWAYITNSTQGGIAPSAQQVPSQLNFKALSEGPLLRAWTGADTYAELEELTARIRGALQNDAMPWSHDTFPKRARVDDVELVGMALAYLRTGLSYLDLSALFPYSHNRISELVNHVLDVLAKVVVPQELRLLSVEELRTHAPHEFVEKYHPCIIGDTLSIQTDTPCVSLRKAASCAILGVRCGGRNVCLTFGWTR